MLSLTIFALCFILAIGATAMLLIPAETAEVRIASTEAAGPDISTEAA